MPSRPVQQSGAAGRRSRAIPSPMSAECARSKRWTASIWTKPWSPIPPTCCGRESSRRNASAQPLTADPEKLLPPFGPERLRLEAGKLAQGPFHGLAGFRDRLVGLAMGPAERLGDDSVDDAEAGEVLCGQSERMSRLFGLVGAVPEDRRAA